MSQVNMMVGFAREDDELQIRFQAGIHGASLKDDPAESGSPGEAVDDFRPDWLPDGVVIGDPSTYEGLTDEQRVKITDEYMKNYGDLFSEFFG